MHLELELRVHAAKLVQRAVDRRGVGAGEDGEDAARLREQAVDDGATTAFTLTAIPPFQVGTVSGCGGSLDGNTYTTGPITADCTVTATFSILDFVFGNGFDP